MSQRTCLSIVLAAGEGTRMKSAKPKVLHEIAGLPMFAHVTTTAAAAGSGDIALVVGHGADEVVRAAAAHAPTSAHFLQAERKGTAHAVLAAREAITRGYDDVLVMFGDTPLLSAEAIADVRGKLAEGAAVVVMGFRTDSPTGYGRLIEKHGALVAIREEKDCSPDERAINFCNGGMMGIAGHAALLLLDAVGNENAKGEFYLTDIVEIAARQGLKVAATEAAFENALGINNRAELAQAEGIWQSRRRREMMLAGVTLIAPETVFFAYDTKISQDVIVEPNVFFGPGVTVGDGANIRAFCHLEEATVGALCEVGPYARLRPGADLKKKAKVGNFCEIKKSEIGEGAKVPHLSYVGDAFIGAKANLGAGTITCNYDGYSKFVTEVGPGAFVGSNSALVAPVRIGRDAYVASGSVISEDVPDDALAFGRARQVTKPGRAKELREQRAAAKAAKAGSK